MKSVSDFLKAYSRTIAGPEEKHQRKTKHTLPIVISRDIGSGGSVLAGALAMRLGFQLCDKTILDQIAAQAKVPPDLVELMDERMGSTLSIFGAGLLRGATINREQFDHYLKVTIKSLLELGSVVILGRGGVFLAQPGKALRVRVVAPLDLRVKNLVEAYNLNEKQARSKIQTTDSERQHFQQRLFGRSEAEAESFDLAINTQCLNLDHALHLVLYTYNRLCRDAEARVSAS
jgi:CMP/dCMP kinase